VNRIATVKIFNCLAIAILAIAVAVALSWTPLLRTLEWKIYDLEFRQLSNTFRASQEIVMVQIDDLSLARMAENDFGRFPWPRDTYTVLLDYFERVRPKVITFDILFLEEDKSQVGEKSGQAADQELIEATGRLGNVVHAVEVNDTYAFLPHEVGVQGYDLGMEIEEHRSVTLPFPALAKASRLLGNSFMVLDRDGPIRRAVPFVRQGSRFYPSLAIATAMVALDLDPAKIRMDMNGLHLGDQLIPLISVEQEYVKRIRARHILVPYRESAYSDEARTVTSYPSYRFWDLFLSELQLRDGKKPEVDPVVFKNKIVFIGTTAAGLHELFQTPFGEEGKMPGMQIHASVVDGILSNSFIRPAALVWSVLLLLSSTLLVSIMGVYGGFWWSLLATATVGFADMAIVTGAFRKGVWLPVVPTSLAIFFSQFSCVAYKYFVEDRAKRQIRSLFSRYVSPAVVNALIADPSKARLGGERREMTVLFADIRGFTTMSEAARAEDVIHQLNEFFTQMVELLFKHHGTLDKFVGDMIMALFNAPLDDPDHPDHAVRMGLAMLDELDTLNQRWYVQGKPKLDIGIGINTGEMIVGNVGSEKTLSYTAIGDNVNLGARLESLNKDYNSHIIISEETLARLKGEYHVRALGSVKVKGKSRLIAIYEVCRSAEALQDRS
jgi:adenylate cyclase